MIFSQERFDNYFKEMGVILSEKSNRFESNKMKISEYFYGHKLEYTMDSVTVLKDDVIVKHFEINTESDCNKYIDFLEENIHSIENRNYFLSNIAYNVNECISNYNLINSRINKNCNLAITNLNSKYMKSELRAIESLYNFKSEHDNVIDSVIEFSEHEYKFRYFIDKDRRKEIVARYNKLKDLPKTKEDIISYETTLISKISTIQAEDYVDYLYNMYYSNIKSILQPKDDFEKGNSFRDCLDVLITMVEILDSILLKEEINRDVKVEYIEWSPMINYLLKVKIDKFGKDLLGELGFDIVGKSGSDYLIVDTKKELN